MTIAIEITCRSCGKTYIPEPVDYRRGTWRICPACRALATATTGQPRDGPSESDGPHAIAHRPK